MPKQQNPTFSYKARTPTGKILTGQIKAPNRETVSQYLLDNDYLPIEVDEVSLLQKDLSFGKKRVKPKEVANFIRQLATLNKAGLPLSRALDVLRDQASNPTLKQVIIDIRKDLDSGSRLTEAMEKHENVFPPLVISMVNAGEIGGFLVETLDSIATSLEADVKLRQKIKSAMTYPVAILCLAGLIVTAMLIFIVPIFSDMFANLGGELPAATQFLVNLSNFLKIGGIPMVIGIIVFVMWWKKNKHKRSIREFVDPIKLKMPIFGALTQKIVMARFTRNFAALMSAGLPVLQVLDIVGGTSGSIVLEDALKDVKKAVSQGEKLAPNFAKHYEIFPRSVAEMASVGEDAGEIPEIMLKVADIYDTEVTETTEQLSSLLEPLMLIVLGGTVGGIVISLYMPIFGIYDLIGS